jgi:hypothetical protein
MLVHTDRGTYLLLGCPALACAPSASWWTHSTTCSAAYPRSSRALPAKESSDSVSNLMGARLSVTSPLAFGLQGIRPGPDSCDHGLRTSPRALIGLAPPRTHKDRVLGNDLHRSGPPGWSGAATCGSQTPMGLSTRTGLGGLDLPSLREGVRCRHVPPRRRQLDQPYHVPVAKGLPWDAGPTTALNAGRWAAHAQDRAWPAH